MFDINIFLPFLVAFIISIVSTFTFIPIFKKFGLVDDPKKHKHPAIIHTKPIPRGGGIPLFLGVFIAGLIFLPINKITLGIFSAAFLALVIGTLDDKYDLSRYLRFGFNFICAAIVVGVGIGIPFITNPFGGILHLDFLKFTFDFLGLHTIFVLSDLLALIWVVWTMNMLNWSKGVDGQMPGVVAISAVVIGILSLRFSTNDPLTLTAVILSFALAGSALGFLVFNFHPAKIFPGYGATSIYLLLATLAILSGAKLATAVLVMGVPLVDGIFTVARRILSGKSPFWHDKKHLHHLLLSLGYSQRNIALFYWIISAILGTVALTLTSTQKLFAIIMLIIIVGGGLVFLHKVTTDEQQTL